MIRKTIIEIINTDTCTINEYSMNARALADGVYAKETILKKIVSIF
jgi:hypothetical protein